MTNETHHRRSIRLHDYDYSQQGIYFVTTCAEERRCIFGSVKDDHIVLSKAGEIVCEVWNALPGRFPFVQTDTFIVMSNHFHGILAFHPESDRGAASSAPTRHRANLGRVMRAFKSISAVKIKRALSRSTQGVCQRNYYERIVRDGDELSSIQRYIAENPLRWTYDRENPQAIPLQDPKTHKPWRV